MIDMQGSSVEITIVLIDQRLVNRQVISMCYKERNILIKIIGYGV